MRFGSDFLYGACCLRIIAPARLFGGRSAGAECSAPFSPAQAQYSHPVEGLSAGVKLSGKARPLDNLGR